MDDIKKAELRLECLKLAVGIAIACHGGGEVVDIAKEMAEFVLEIVEG